jgi:hypothetical protein
MRIVIGPTTNIHVGKSSKSSSDFTPKKKKKRERRKNKQDRRKSVRDGVIVSLSFKNDRRVRKDRRRTVSN